MHSSTIAASNGSAQLFNPDTYLNHLPPQGARDYEVCRNVTLVILGITVWDILVYVQDDLEIIKRSCFRSPIFCFVFARIFAFGYIFCSAIQLTTPLNNQVALLYVELVFCALAVGCSSYLFLRRVHAVYTDNPWVQWFFSAFWFICYACGVSIFFCIAPVDIPGTLRFQDTGAMPTFAISLYGIVAFDTTIVSGRALPRFSREVLQGGQQYYLFTAGMMITAVTLVSIPSVGSIVKGTVVTPLIPLSAPMACRVFRNIKGFDYYNAASTDLPASELSFQV